MERVYMHKFRKDFKSGEDYFAYDRAYKRELYLAAKARKDAQIEAMGLSIADIPAEILSAIEADCRRYRQARIKAALRKIGEVKLADKE